VRAGGDVGQTWDQLIKAAKDLFASKGYTDTALEDLVAKGGHDAGRALPSGS
jgi:hypothetical protein